MNVRSAAGPLSERLSKTLDGLIAAGRERGVQVAVYREGRLVGEAWGGMAHPLTGDPVGRDTLFPVFSVSKGIAATVIHRLVERGALRDDLPLAEIWPAFSGEGRETISLEHALRHQAGLPALPDGLTFAEMLDWDAACRALARTRPSWSPGSRFAYHAKTYGWLIGEPACRVTGKTFSQLVQEEVAGPLGLGTLHLGLPRPERHAIAFLEENDLGPIEVPPFSVLASTEAAGVPMTHQMNSAEMQSACLPSSNGLMNARAIARHYAALLPGGIDGIELVSQDRLRRARDWQTHQDPAGQPATWGLGYTRVEIVWKGRRVEGFGHGGYGGSMGFAFPRIGLAVGYTRNRLGAQSGWDDLIATIALS